MMEEEREGGGLKLGGHNHSTAIRIWRSRNAAFYGGLRHFREAQAAFWFWRRRASLPRPLHCSLRYDRGARLLAQRIRNPRYEGEPTWLPDSGNNGPIELPIAFDLETPTRPTHGGGSANNA